MWETSEGIRKLAGAEGDFVFEVAQWYFEQMDTHLCDEDAEGWHVRIPVFDTMPILKRAGAILYVTRLLLNDEAPCPLTAWSEAAAAAIYEYAKDLVEMEIDEPMEGDETFWRKRIQRAWMQTVYTKEFAKEAKFGPGEGHRQRVNSTDLDEWHSKIEALAGHVFFDDDWLSIDSFVDLHPNLSDPLKKHMGISKDYYTSVPDHVLFREDRSLLEQAHNDVFVKNRKHHSKV